MVRINTVRNIFAGIVGYILVASMSHINLAYAEALLQDMQLHPLGGGRTQLYLEFSEPVAAPRGFSVEAPGSIVLDFSHVKNALSKNKAHQKVNLGVIREIAALGSEDKTRIVLNVNQIVPYESEVKGNAVVVTFADPTFVSEAPSVFNGEKDSQGYTLEGVDFHRDEKGAGRLVVDLSSTKVAIDLNEQSGKMLLRFMGGRVADNLVKTFSVTDFATPVQSFRVYKKDNDSFIEITATAGCDKIAYQMDKQFIVEFKEISAAEKTAIREKSGQYVGDKLSLNFQDIEVRAVLQLLADFTGFNLITSDAVKGNVTLRLKNVPWDQALDIVLKTRGLDKRLMGNILLVGPAAELAAREKLDLENSQKVLDLSPLRTEFVQINYAKAEDVAALLKDKTSSLLSNRGNVTLDKRTNILLVQDTEMKIKEIRDLLKELDKPISQVLIDTQIVETTIQLGDYFGIMWGMPSPGVGKMQVGRRRFGVGNSFYDAASVVQGLGSSTVGTMTDDSQRFFIDLSNSNATGISNTGQIGLGFLSRVPNGTLLDLELQALESESKIRAIARPKLLTMDQTKAKVEQGVQIPYQAAASSGATTVQFAQATLSLEVTPHITPDEKIGLDLAITQDTVGATTTAGPAINTQRMNSTVLVGNNETVVLGGIFSNTLSKSETRIPFISRIPVIGKLFKNYTDTENRDEILIFVTPKILKPVVQLDN